MVDDFPLSSSPSSHLKHFTHMPALTGISQMTDSESRRVENIVPPIQVSGGRKAVTAPGTEDIVPGMMTMTTPGGGAGGGGASGGAGSAVPLRAMDDDASEFDRPLMVYSEHAGSRMGRRFASAGSGSGSGWNEEGGREVEIQVDVEDDDDDEDDENEEVEEGDGTTPSDKLPAFQRLQPSVIRKIISYVSSLSSDYERSKTLPQLCLVSRKWLTPARKELYSAPLSLFARTCPFSKAEKLLATIEGRSDPGGGGGGGGGGEVGDGRKRRVALGRYVNSLAWLGYWTTRFRNRVPMAEPSLKNEINEWALRMIAGCPKVQCLTLPLGHASDKPKLFDLLRYLRRLETLIIDRPAEEDLDLKTSPNMICPVGIEDLGKLNDPRKPPIKELIIRSSHFLPRTDTAGITWHLESLCLHDVQLDEFNILVILWGSHDTLRKLELVRCSSLSTSEGNRGSGLRHILGRIGPKLRELRVQRQTIRDQPPTEPFAELELICTACVNLEILSIGGDLLLTDGLFRRLGIGYTKLKLLRIALRPSESATAAGSCTIKNDIYSPSKTQRDPPLHDQITARNIASALLLGPKGSFASLKTLDMSWIGWGADDVDSVVEAGRLRGIEANVSVSSGPPGVGVGGGGTVWNGGGGGGAGVGSGGVGFGTSPSSSSGWGAFGNGHDDQGKSYGGHSFPGLERNGSRNGHGNGHGSGSGFGFGNGNGSGIGMGIGTTAGAGGSSLVVGIGFSGSRSGYRL